MIETDRLLLRQWTQEDKEPFARLNSDPEVMRYFPRPHTVDESNRTVDNLSRLIGQQGWGIYAVEEQQTGSFVGFAGLNCPTWKAHFTPCTEIGWRLAKEHWGNGYATEAALACIRFSRENLDIDEIVSFTSALNLPSIAVMERIGMARDPGGDFMHPNLAESDPLALHVLYRLQI